MVVVYENTLSLIRQGVSLNKISKLTGLGKSTLYFHYKKIKGKKYSPIHINFVNKRDLGEFLGIFSGDGSFYKNNTYHYLIRVYTGYYEKQYADYLKKIFLNWFGKKPNIYISYFKGKKSSISTCYSSKELYLLIRTYLSWEGKKTYSVRLKKLDLNDREFNLGFIKGLIDTDGSFYAPKRRLSFSSVSKNLVSQVFSLIEFILKEPPNLNVTRKKGYHDLYTLTLHGEKAKKLINLIKPSNINKRYAAIV